MRVNSQAPGCFILLIDTSESMRTKASHDETFLSIAIHAANDFLEELVLRCSDGERASDYYFVALIGYRLNKDQNVVLSNLGGAEHNSGFFQTTSDLFHTGKFVDADGCETTELARMVAKRWIDTLPAPGKPMTSQTVVGGISSWRQLHPHSFAPIIIHLTCAAHSSQSLETLLHELTTSTGATYAPEPVLINVVLTTDGFGSLQFPEFDVPPFEDPARVSLWNISRFLPPSLAEEYAGASSSMLRLRAFCLAESRFQATNVLCNVLKLLPPPGTRQNRQAELAELREQNEESAQRRRAELRSENQERRAEEQERRANEQERRARIAQIVSIVALAVSIATLVLAAFKFWIAPHAGN